MKIKILSSAMKTFWYSDRIGDELYVDYNVESVGNPFIYTKNHHYIRSCDSVITELPESFCVKRCDDKKWDKYIKWLNITYKKNHRGDIYSYYGNLDCNVNPSSLGTEIHIDDIIKHIDYMENKDSITVKYENGKFIEVKEEFDLTTNEGRLAYARKHYPIGTKYISVGESKKLGISDIEPRLWGGAHIECGEGFIYANGKWAEIIKEEINMETQKLSRQGLKEIHSVACSSWKQTLEQYGSRNPLEDYIELTQEEVNKMFNASDEKQKSVLSKYLKYDDGSVDVTEFNTDSNGFFKSGLYIIRDREMGKYAKKSFLLAQQYNWEIKTDELGQLCLIPTKKK